MFVVVVVVPVEDVVCAVEVVIVAVVVALLVVPVKRLFEQVSGILLSVAYG